MPDVILHHILSFIPIDHGIRTSTLSRRWRHVWCETPCIHFGDYSCGKPRVRDINQTLISYKAPKIKSFHLCVPEWVPELEPGQIDSWIEFAVSRNVEELFLSFNYRVYGETYRFPHLLYRSSSLENLSLDFLTIHTRGFTLVSWKSLRTLRLGYCSQSPDHDFLSGCPALETLTLGYCGGVHRLDLSNSSPTLTTLKIIRHQSDTPGLFEIVAPHLRYLDLKNTEEPCTLVDVSSLTKARVNIRMDRHYSDNDDDDVKADFLQLENMLLKMLAKLSNVEELTFKTAFLQIISLAELRGVPFSTLNKVHTLTFKTMFARSVIPGIARLLQNSPGLKKLIVHAREPKTGSGSGHVFGFARLESGSMLEIKI
nr:PREDICTED: putative F-box/LRR-repeat protein At3g28410 [Raphanus sativus]